MAEPLDHEHLPSLYHSDELSQEDRGLFEAHLGSCSDCRACLQQLGWAAELARAAAISPEPALTRRALQRAFGARTPEWDWRDWTRSAGMGFGLAFAVGLFLFRAAHPAASALSWRSGISTELAELDGRLESLDADLSLDAWNVEFNERLDELNRSQQGLKSQLDRPEEV